MKRRYDNDSILVYSCLHAPFQHKNALDFLRDVADYYKPDRVIDLGDTLDNYCFSRYPKDPMMISAKEEIKRARKVVDKLGKLFPKVDLCRSNHCDRLYSKATASGVPREFILPYKDIIGAPDQWTWHNEITLTVNKTREQIFFCHEKGSDVQRIAKGTGMTSVIGHVHSALGAQWISNPIRNIFAAYAGCLCSDEGSPFSYNRGQVFRPVRGCLMIIEGSPQIIPMMN